MTKMMLPAAMLAGVLSVGNGVAMESAADSASSLDGAYFGLGLGGNFLDNTLYAGNVKLNKSANRFMGTAILGAGKVFGNKLYAGVEGLVDFAKKSNVRTNKDDIEVAFKNRGIVPELALRLGYVYNTYMFYGKIGCSFGKTDTYASDGVIVVWGRVNNHTIAGISICLYLQCEVLTYFFTGGGFSPSYPTFNLASCCWLSFLLLIIFFKEFALSFCMSKLSRKRQNMLLTGF